MRLILSIRRQLDLKHIEIAEDINGEAGKNGEKVPQARKDSIFIAIIFWIDFFY